MLPGDPAASPECIALLNINPNSLMVGGTSEAVYCACFGGVYPVISIR